MQKVKVVNRPGSKEVLQVRLIHRGVIIAGTEKTLWSGQGLIVTVGSAESLQIRRLRLTGKPKTAWRAVVKAEKSPRKPTKKKTARKKPAKRKAAKKRKKNPCPKVPERLRPRARGNPKKAGPGVRPPAEWIYYKVATIKKRDKTIGAPAAVAGKIWKRMADSTRERIMRNVAKARARTRRASVVTSYGILTRAQVVKRLGKRAADSLYKRIGKR